MKQPMKTKTIKRWGLLDETGNISYLTYPTRQGALNAVDKLEAALFGMRPVRLTITYYVPKGKLCERGE